jgi:hypothetical protein
MISTINTTRARAGFDSQAESFLFTFLTVHIQSAGLPEGSGRIINRSDTHHGGIEWVEICRAVDSLVIGNAPQAATGQAIFL